MVSPKTIYTQNKGKLIIFHIYIYAYVCCNNNQRRRVYQLESGGNRRGRGLKKGNWEGLREGKDGGK